jgi:DNA/RNA-binding domain of Phe-tRNA-synthetase-like protein
MNLNISPAIFERFPNTVLGVVIAHGIDNTGEKPEVLHVLREAEAQTVQAFSGVTVSEHPHIAVWREAYRQFGSKPKDYPSSVENLVRRISKGYQLPHINLLVDIYNTVSLRHVLPVGGEDLDTIEGDVWLTFASENEAPVVLLGESEARAPYPGEVIYRDNVGAICRRWNWKEADRTKFTPATRNAFLVIEGLPPVSHSLIETAITELAASVREHCGGSVSTALLDSSRPVVLLTA